MSKSQKVVLYSPTIGFYMGNDHWSKKNPSARGNVIVFINQDRAKLAVDEDLDNVPDDVAFLPMEPDSGVEGDEQTVGLGRCEARAHYFLESTQ